MTLKTLPAIQVCPLFLLILSILLVPGASNAEKAKKTILYLNSYHNGYEWSDSEYSGIRSRLEKSPYKIDLQVEYLDAKRYNTEPVLHPSERLSAEVYERAF